MLKLSGKVGLGKDWLSFKASSAIMYLYFPRDRLSMSCAINSNNALSRNWRVCLFLQLNILYRIASWKRWAFRSQMKFKSHYKLVLISFRS